VSGRSGMDGADSKQSHRPPAVAVESPKLLHAESNDLVGEDVGGSHSCGPASMAEMLRRKRHGVTILSSSQLLKYVAGTMAKKMQSDTAGRKANRPRPIVRDELWRHLVSATKRRTDAVQALHNIASTLEAQMKATPSAARGVAHRITAFRFMTGIATNASSVWPPQQADFYFLALQALYPSWSGKAHEHYEKVLSAETILVQTSQVSAALKYLVKDHILLRRIMSRVEAVDKEAQNAASSHSPSPSGAPNASELNSSPNARVVDLDWIMAVLMQAWEDSQLAAARALNQIFTDADENGDGILQLDEFREMIAQRKPDITEGEAFKLYDEALGVSEQMLGYETDAILSEAFTKVALAHNLFSELPQPLTSAEAAVHMPPPNWPGGGGLNQGRVAKSPAMSPVMSVDQMLKVRGGSLSPGLGGSPTRGAGRPAASSPLKGMMPSPLGHF
jgi:hypothetical protein